METKTFSLVGFDESGIRKSGTNGENWRLVCLIQGNGKLAIWGNDSSHQNIDAVQGAGMPCEVECERIKPQDWARKHGHTYWVPQGRNLRVVKR